LRLRIIFENLLENAINYTEGDKKEVSVFVGNDAKNLILRISDTGIGIPESEQKNIFSEFYRAANARVLLSSGSGIGLYLTDQYVKAHHGSIDFKSEENKGTTFNVKIPLRTSLEVKEFFESV
jgi:signal transduction histidine kinase